MAAATAATKEGLSNSMGFGTVKNTFPDAAAQLVELMRATLRHAQEITASVGEAEGANERAQSVVTNIDNTTTTAEQAIANAEIEKVLNWLNRPQETLPEQRGRTAAYPTSPSAAPASAASVPASVTTPTVPSNAPRASALAPTSFVPAASPAAASGSDESVGAAQAGGSGQGAPALSGVGAQGSLGSKGAMTPYGSLLDNESGMPTLYGQSAATFGTKTLTSEMAEEIETTVMWVQQLLESVHFVESEDVFEPGASLLSIVQPGRRGQKEIAVHQSVHLFHEKKEEEEDADEERSKFRNRALQAVQMRRQEAKEEAE